MKNKDIFKGILKIIIKKKHKGKKSSPKWRITQIQYIIFSTESRYREIMWHFSLQMNDKVNGLLTLSLKCGIHQCAEHSWSPAKECRQSEDLSCSSSFTFTFTTSYYRKTQLIKCSSDHRLPWEIRNAIEKC